MDVRIIHIQHAGYPICISFIDYPYDSSLPVAKLADASMISDSDNYCHVIDLLVWRIFVFIGF